MINKLYKWAETGFLKRAANSTIHLESAIRGEKKGKGISSEVKRESTVFSVKNIKDWKAAVAIASDPENPSFEFLADLYTHLKLDNHLVAAIETRIYRVLRSLYVFKNEKGEVNHNLRAKFDRPWFEKFISIAIWSLFSGVKVAELGNLDEHLELIQVNEIPMQNTIPKKGIIIKQVGDTTGWNYKEGAFSPYYIQIGANDQLGDLVNLTPMILSKKLAMGSWLDFIEKYGVPQIWITTDREDPDRFDELFEMAINMRSNNVAVLRGKEKIESGDVSQGDAYKTFKELISLVNSEISKRVLGQDGTTDAKDVSGNYGSLKILQEVANDRHESDKLFIENLINKELIPRLMKLSSFYSDLQGHYFDWDDTEQMKKEEFIDNVVKLEGAGFELDLDQISEKTGLSIKGRKNTTEEVEPIKKKS
ncbi:phage portal protein family protein [Tenacibaculum maritimum]|uniref:phage portal protein family protein n=1 Tax=Tenacibaculum maritimum TaxID=107401 RepID=UPI0038770A4E